MKEPDVVMQVVNKMTRPDDPVRSLFEASLRKKEPLIRRIEALRAASKRPGLTRQDRKLLKREFDTLMPQLYAWLAELRVEFNNAGGKVQ